MEQQTNNIVSDQKVIQFNIGKSYGLSGKDGSEKHISEYKARMLAIENDLKKIVEIAISEVAEKLKTLESQLSRTYDLVLEKQQKFVEGQLSVISSISKIKKEFQGNDSAIKKVDDIMNANLEKISENISDKVQITSELNSKMGDFKSQTDALINNLKTKYEAFINSLEERKVGFTEIENGFQYGKALLAALSKV